MKTTTVIFLACAAAANADTTTLIERSMETTPAGATDLVPRRHGPAGEIAMSDKTVTITPDFSPPFDFPSIYISKDRKSEK